MNHTLNRFDLMGVLDKSVVDPAGNRLGKIQRLLVEENGGRIEYATLELESERTDSRLLVTVPWTQFQPTKDRQRLEVHVGQATLKSVAARHAVDP